MNYYTDELYHYGVKGMKWGVRRYQNPDGSYTAVGRVHYGIKSTADKVKRNVRDAYEKAYNSPDNVKRREQYQAIQKDVQKHLARQKRKAAARKRAKEKLQRDPYGTKQKYPNIDQKLNKARDETRFGTNAVKRIQKKIDSGMTYKQALRGEKQANAILRTSEWLLVDQLFHNGSQRKMIENMLYVLGGMTVNSIKNVANERRRRNSVPKVDVERAWDIDKKKWVNVT